MKRLLERDPITGISKYHHYDPLTDVTIIEEVQDCQAILDRNKNTFNNVDNFRLKASDMRHYATIPNVIINKWLAEEGINVFSKDPGMIKKVKQKLNSPDWRYLRTAPGKI